MSKTKLLAVSTVCVCFGMFAESCEAGPLLDWLRGRPVVNRINAIRNNAFDFRNTAFRNNGFGYNAYRYNAYRYNAYRYNAYRYNAFYRGPLGAPLTGAPLTGAPLAQNYAQLPGTCTKTCPKTGYQTVNRVVANYVPYTAFRTQWCRVPVTYYRPVTSTHPQTGCISTCMQPYTYYQMQARKVPYTTYQTVYRTVQHRVPYTVYETTYGNAGCGSCSSCGTNATTAGTVQNSTPAYTVPANVAPKLDASEIKADTTLQKPVSQPPVPTEDPNTNNGDNGDKTKNSSHVQPQLNVPANPAPVVDDSNRTASLIRGKWNYSPVRDAGYLISVDGRRTPSNSQFSGFIPENSKPSRPAFRNSGWQSVNQ